MNRFFLILLCVGIMFPRLSQAEEQKQEVLNYKTPLNFIPEKAFFVVKYSDQSIVQYKSLIIPPLKKAESDVSSGEWTIGTFIPPHASASVLSYNLFLKGKQSEGLYLSNISLIPGNTQPYAQSGELMKQQIDIRKQILKSLQVQNSTQAANLKRLRADAEVIANLSRIVEIVEESEIVKSEIENLDEDLELLRTTFQAVKGMSAPKNYLRREMELTKQSDDLLKIVKETEFDEESRKSVSQTDIEKKLSMIEQTRFEDEDKLRQELIRLKTHAANAKKNKDTAEKQPKDYWDIQ